MDTGAAFECMPSPLLPPSVAEVLRMPDATPERIVQACHDAEALLAALLPLVPPPIAALRLQRPTRPDDRTRGRYTTGTVVVVDLAGFNVAAGRLAAYGREGSEALSAIVNQTLLLLSTAIHAHGGSIVAFAGDTLTALFDAAALGREHVLQACSAALQMQAQLAGMDQPLAAGNEATEWPNGGLPVRMGVHTGQLFVVEVGTSDQAHLLITGHAIHRVAAVLDAAANQEIVISGETAQELAGAELLHRSKGFAVLQALAVVVPPMPVQVPTWSAGAPSRQTLDAILERTYALLPYLPPGLPPRLLHDATTGGEFRPVTLLVSNVYGFSRLLELLEPLAILYDNPSLIAQVIQSYYTHIAGVIGQYGGIINSVNLATVGDRFVALFGAPTAHEDDPQRAVQAALALPNALHAINRDIVALLRTAAHDHAHQRSLLRLATVALRQRVGVVNGVVFAGLIGSHERRIYTVLGQTVQLAVEMMQRAKDGEILLPSGTNALVRQLVETQLLPPAADSPSHGAMKVYRAIRSRPLASPSLPRSAPLVGREHELHRLMSLAEHALQPGQTAGQIVVLQGELGSGKSRLVQELLQLIRTTLPEVDIVAADCQSYEQITPYAAISRLLIQEVLPDRHSEQFTEDEEEEQQAIASAEHYLAEYVPEMRRFAPLLGPLLALPMVETRLTAALSSEQRRERLHELVAAIYRAAARRRPLVMVLDDLHWADASTHMMVARLAEAVRGVPFLLVLPYRPTLRMAEPWRSLAWCTFMEVEALDQAMSKTLLAALLQGDPPPEIQPLLERTEGTPFFLEETVRYLLDAGALERNGMGDWVVAHPELLAQVPVTVEQLITARLDRLAPEHRTLIELAAVIGRRFDAHLIAAALPAETALLEHLDALVEVALLEREDAANRGATLFLFKHALTHDVAYRSILFARRRELHASVAAAIKQVFAVQLDEHRAVLGQHYLLAGDAAQAWPHFVTAAIQAQHRYANAEAIALYEQALLTGPWHGAPEATASYGAAAALYQQLADVQTLIGELEQARTNYLAALACCTKLPTTDPAEVAGLERSLAHTYDKQGRYDEALTHLALATAALGAQHPLEQAYIDADAGWIAFLQGDTNEAEQRLNQALAVVEQQPDVALQSTILRRMAGIHFRRGNLAAAKTMLEQGLVLSRRLGDQMSVAATLTNLGIVAQQEADLAQAETYYNTSRDIYVQHGDVVGQMRATLNSGTASVMQGYLPTASEAFATSWELAQRMHDALHMTLSRINQGRVAFLANDLVQARCYFIEAERLAATIKGNPSDRSEIADFLGRIAFRQGRYGVARRLAGRALRLAEQGDEILPTIRAKLLLTLLAAHDRNFERAEQLVEELDQAIDPQPSYERALLLLVRRDLLRQQGELGAAKQQQRQAATVFKQLKTPEVLRVFV